MSTIRNKKIAIIGAGLGGLSAAIHLRSAGFDVTVFEANEYVGGRANKIASKGFTFDTGPSLLNYPWVFEQLFAVAGRSFKDEVPLIPVNPSIKFYWRNGNHLQLSSNFSQFLFELERFEDRVGPAATRFFRTASKQYQIAFDKLVAKNADTPLQWFGNLTLSEISQLTLFRSFNSELKKYFKSKYIREALGSYAMYLGGSPFELPGIFTILPYGELAYGLWLPKGGIYALVEKIQQLAESLGVEIRCSTPIQEINVANGKCVGITTATGDFYPYDIVVSNVDVPTTTSQLLPKTSRKNSSRWKMTCSVVTMYWGINKKLPEIPHHTIFLPDHYEKTFEQLGSGNFPDDIPFYISIPSKSDFSLAPQGNETMFVLVPVPLLSHTRNLDWKKKVDELKEQVFMRLAWHNIPLSTHDISVEQIWTPNDWAQKFGLYDGSAFGAVHTLFNVGAFRHKNYDVDVQGLYYVGASTVPGTGMPMVVLSGKMTAERILSHVH